MGAGHQGSRGETVTIAGYYRQFVHCFQHVFESSSLGRQLESAASVVAILMNPMTAKQAKFTSRKDAEYRVKDCDQLKCRAERSHVASLFSAYRISAIKHPRDC
jgi:hypothetical protein